MSRIASLLHPFLFALSSAVFIYIIASVIASPDQMFRAILVYFGILILVLIPVYWMTKDWAWTGIMLSILSVTFFTTPDIFRALSIIVLASLIVGVSQYRVRKIQVEIKKIIAIINFSGVIFLLIVLSALISRLLEIPFQSYPQVWWPKRELPFSLSRQQTMPDIYYIVLDGYGRADVLRDYYDFDNQEFIDELTALGFIVPAQSRSNYPKTILSIPSTLNMDYVENLTPKLIGSNTQYWWLMKPLMMDSNVRRMLEGVGYRSFSTTTGWGPTDNPTTDVYYKPDRIILNDMEFAVIVRTPLKFLAPFLSSFAYVPSYQAHHDLVLRNFDFISNASRVAGQKFVFAHIVSPHPPFVFDENGDLHIPEYPYSFNDANDIKLTDEEYQRQYVSQLKFINKKTLELVTKILNNSKTPPVIIIQADHGPGSMTDFFSAENSCLRERFSIFAAYYLPDAGKDIIPDDITPVNLFRIIFNQYFGADFMVLPNLYYYTNGVLLFQSEDVSEKVDTCAAN